MLLAPTLLASHASTALALPDLVPDVYDIQVVTRDVLQGDVDEGCAGGRYNRRLVSFSMLTTNVGADDLVLGDPGCPNCALNPGATCTNPLFQCGTSHGHAHFEGFAKNQILDGDGNVVAEGKKYGFCLLDTICPTPHYSCSYQGLTAGCGDVYSAGLPCQYVDITDDDLPDGVYTLRTIVDPLNELEEGDDSNNTVEAQFTIGSTARVCPAYESTDVPKPLVDLGTTTSVVHVPDIGPVTELRVRLEGTHSYLGDLETTLSSPAATTRTLFSHMCTLNDDFDLYLGDRTVDELICPAISPDALRKPLESFDAFNAESAGGDWTLAISDDASGDTGTLQSWSLEICSLCGNGVIDPGEACDDGNALDGDCCSADCLTAAANGDSCEDGNLCTIAETCQDGACVPGGDVTCDPCLVCDSAAGCVVPDIVYPCQTPPSGGSKLRIRHADADPTRDAFLWKWKSQTPVETDELGAPDLVTDVSVCVYGGNQLLMSSTIPAARTCGGAPCWLRRLHTTTFRDDAAFFGGLTSIRMKEGSTGTIRIKGKGDALGIDALQPDLPLTVRLRRSDGTPCWEAVYDSGVDDTPEEFKAFSR